MEDEKESMFTLVEASEVLGICTSELHKLVEDKEIAYKIVRRFGMPLYYISEEDLEEFKNSSTYKRIELKQTLHKIVDLMMDM